MDESSALMLKRYFKEYYFRYSDRIVEPDDMKSREFGYFQFGGGMIRHLSFNDIGALRALLVREAPAGVYCSNSHYQEPSAEIQKKGWSKAELIFDIDANSLRLPCKKVHDIWICKQCGKKEFGLRPGICPECNGNRLLELPWACPICLDGSKKETLKLLNFLEGDLGVANSQIRIYFSGNAGYHIEVIGTSLELLDQHGRAEIADYLSGQGALINPFKTAKLSHTDPGWKGRVARYIRDLPPNSPPFKSHEFDKRIKELISSKSDQMNRVVETAIRSNSVRIDAMVTTDIHRIFRMPETLNNKTGLVKRQCRDLMTFDPLTEGIALRDEKETIEVSVEFSPKLEIGGNVYGPFMNETRALPLYAAVYLVAKGAARVSSKEASAKLPGK